MNMKLKGNVMLNGDVLSPDMPVATFDEGLVPQYKHKIVETLNAGHEMLMIYKQYRDNLSLPQVIGMLERMEKIYNKYSYFLFEIQKQEWKDN